MLGLNGEMKDDAEPPAGHGMKHTTLRAYRVFDEVIALLCESPDMTEHIDCFMKHMAVAEGDEAMPTKRLAVFNAPRNRQILCCPEVGLATSVPKGRPAWVAFRRLFLHLVLTGGEPGFMMHASCVADDAGRACLVCGHQDTGKTSLLAALLARGYRLVADDYSMITFSDGRVRALPVGVTVTGNTCQMLPELKPLLRGACRFHLRGAWQWTINLGDLYPHAEVSDRFEPTLFCFLKGPFGGASSLTPCGRDEALWLFQEGRFCNESFAQPLQKCPADYREQAAILGKSMVDKARFCRVTNGDVRETARLIAEEFEK